MSVPVLLADMYSIGDRERHHMLVCRGGAYFLGYAKPGHLPRTGLRRLTTTEARDWYDLMKREGRTYARLDCKDVA